LTATRAHAVSDVGLTRSNNQDSGYAGRRLFVVADGMGGHAGGDVASAIVIQRLADLEEDWSTPSEAEEVLVNGYLAANDDLADTVAEHPELTGMGTTVSGIALVGRSVVVAHIGDSRVYRFRDGALTQLTSDHTFVQRLVETGRITVEEAAHHPRRSVLMRVLGDVDAVPDVDTMIFDTRPGDRWLLCSDGLSSYVAQSDIHTILSDRLPTESTTAALLKAAMDVGAPDNVTVILLDIADEPMAPGEPQIVGSAAKPVEFAAPPVRRQPRLPTLLLHPFQSTTSEPETHFEPETDEYLEALVAEDQRRRRRRRITLIVVIVLVVAAVGTALIAGYRYTQTRYYIGEVSGKVALYQGVQQDLGPIKLSHLISVTDIVVDDLPPYRQDVVRNTIPTDSLGRANSIIQELSDAATQ